VLKNIILVWYIILLRCGRVDNVHVSRGSRRMQCVAVVEVAGCSIVVDYGACRLMIWTRPVSISSCPSFSPFLSLCLFAVHACAAPCNLHLVLRLREWHRWMLLRTAAYGIMRLNTITANRHCHHHQQLIIMMIHEAQLSTNNVS